ncbi:MAG: SAM-dependent methyltransferase [Epulopiscium sp. Nele67-Bin001]|nr:MAG: SAM-dependent methyltransferase [Epulopiscium sp. Nele67-Bin001]
MIEILEQIYKEQTLINAIWSNPRKCEATKIILQPVILNDKYTFQFEVIINNQAHHYNVEQSNLADFLQQYMHSFKQVQIYTSTCDYSILVNKKGVANIKKHGATKKLTSPMGHNRSKQYILNDAQFFIKLGIMTADGNIKPSKYDKYKQINKYIEIVDTVIREQEIVRIVDFGCGKSYLTFALYHYLTEVKKRKVCVIGLDLKKDVIEFCNNLAKQLNYENLHFQVGDIGKYTTQERVDMVVSLHACNTATDLAIAKAVDWRAKVILAVPCCHNECYKQISSNLLNPIMKHGILKEKIAAHITDGLRAQLLEVVGYKVNVIEFIDLEHTPKNILIRAVLNKPLWGSDKYAEYSELSTALNIDLTLNQLLTNQKGSV